jgi:hypothetical protein
LCPVGVDSGGERSYVGTAAQAARKTPKRTVTMTSANKMTIGEQEKENFVHLRLKYGGNFPINFTGVIEYPDGNKWWYKNGKQHREDGPAVEYSNGEKHWYLKNQKYSEQDWKVKVQELKEPKMETLKVKSTSEIPKNYTGVVEYPNGTKQWWAEGKPHREDGPAVEYSDGEKHWYKEGKLHREGGPAIERVNGTKHWYKEDKLHREDGPAKEYADGTKYWFKEGYQYSEEEWKVKVQELKEPKTKVLKLKNHESPPQNFTGIVEHSLATKIWYKQGKWHREDGPAIEYSNGDKEWFKEGKRHRLDGPAVERSNRDKEWWLEAESYTEHNWKLKVQELKESKMEVLKLKKNDVLPNKFTGIVEYSNGDKEWFKEGKCHRLDGPAIEQSDGTKYWYLEGKRHREDGPAVEFSNGTKAWYKNGDRHREDGPACEYADGGVWWYLEGQEYSEEEFNEKITKAAVKKIEPIILKLDWDTPVPFLHTGIAEFPNGTKFWYKDGNLHREDGPAKEYSSGRKHWWLDGKEYSEEEFSRVTTKRAPLTVSPVVVKSEPTTASEPEKQEPTTTKETPEMTSMDKAKAIILSDASIVAQRVAVEQVAKQIQNMIIGLLVSKQKGRQKTAMKTQLEEFFSSKAGSATIKFIAGLALPRVAEYAAKYGLLKPQHLVVVETLATELRIQGETDAALEVMEALSPLVSMLTSGLTAQFESMMNSFAEAPAENLRIDVGGNQNQSSQDHEMESGFVSQKVATG